VSDIDKKIDDRLRKKLEDLLKNTNRILRRHMKAYEDHWLSREGVNDFLKPQIVALFAEHAEVIMERTRHVDLSAETLRRYYEDETRLTDRLEAILRQSRIAKIEFNILERARKEAADRYKNGLAALEGILVAVEQIRAKAKSKAS
jgi:hypothetical protein